MSKAPSLQASGTWAAISTACLSCLVLAGLGWWSSVDAEVGPSDPLALADSAAVIAPGAMDSLAADSTSALGAEPESTQVAAPAAPRPAPAAPWAATPQVLPADTTSGPDTTRMSPRSAPPSGHAALPGETGQLWRYAPTIAPTSEALLHKILSRWDARETLRARQLLKPEVQAREDSLGFRWLPPGHPVLSSPDRLVRQISVQIDSGVVEVQDFHRQDALFPRLRFTIPQYLDRLTRENWRKGWLTSLTTGAKARSTGAARQKGLVKLDLPVELPKQLTPIFGKGEPQLNVRGSERISFGGTSRWRPNVKSTELSRGQSKFPQLDMKQELNLNLSGTIGDKVTVDVDQASQAVTPLANRIKIRYHGYPDEIVQEVNLGNTSLSLPGTSYVTYSGKAEGLFGISALARLAAVNVTMILSKQEGRSDSRNLSKSAETRSVTINDLDYVKAKYFFLRDPDGCPWQVSADSLFVFVDDRNGNNDITDGALPAIVTLNAEDRTVSSAADSSRAEGNFHLLRGGEEGDYVVDERMYIGHPVIVLNRPLDEDDVLAVVVRGRFLSADLSTPTATPVPPAGFLPASALDPLILKMIRPNWGDFSNDLTRGPWRLARRLELKNIYDLGARNILPAGFNLAIRLKKTSGTSNDPDRIGNHTFKEILGLDLSKAGANGKIAGRDDLVDEEFIDYGGGLLRLPDLRPFDPDRSDIPELTVVGTDTIPVPVATNCGIDPSYSYWRYVPGLLGDTRRLSRRHVLPFAPTTPDSSFLRAPLVYDRFRHTDQAADSRYYFEITYRSPVSNIQLNAFNILQGSETVTANGRVLARDRDYTIDYDLGEIEILETANVTESDQISVTYSYLPFGGGTQKTLAGVAASYKPEGGKSSFASAWLFEGRGGVPGLQGRRPRLGEEPSRTLVGEFAGSYRTESWAMTRMADWLPGVEARAPSRLEVEGGVGLSFPNPNTRDKLYVDDFDGAKDVTSLSMSRRSWRPSAIPVQVLPGRPEDERAASHGELYWYSPRQAVQEGDLLPTLERQEGDNNRQVLEFKFLPAGVTESERQQSWVGVVQPLSTRGIDLSRAQFLDVWVNDFIRYDRNLAGSERHGILHIDLGMVSEDAMWYRQDPKSLRLPADQRVIRGPNRQLDSEDLNRDGRLDQGTSGDEDTGLDGRKTGEDGDDPLDDYDYEDSESESNPRKYAGVNGTEGNQELDTEDMNDTKTLDRLNNYFGIAIDLADSTLWETDVFRDYNGRSVNFPIADNNGWRRIRIPLRDEELVRGYHDTGVEPSWDRIFHARLWAEGFADSAVLQIGGLEITGNRWFQGPLADRRDKALPDSSLAPGEDFFVSVLNNKDDAAVYTPPFTPGKQNNVREREQSVTMELTNFPPDHRASIYRTYPVKQDYTLYQNMEFYLNRNYESGTAALQCAIRLCRDAGTDTTNYYEYRVPVPSGWTLYHIDFGELSRLQLEKCFPDTCVIVRELESGATITRKGTPSLTSVQRIAFYVSNEGSTQLGRGNVWIDELRLTQVKKDPGVAERIQVAGSFSDFLSFNGNFQRSNADFLKIGSERGSGTTSTSWAAGGNLGLDRFVPSLGVQLPVRINLSGSRAVPKFQTSSDLVLDRATDRDITQRGSREVTLGFSKQGGDNPWIKYLLSPFSANGSYRRTIDLAPLARDTTVTRGGNVGWNLPLTEVGGIDLGRGFKARYLPDNLSLTVNGSRTTQSRYTRSDLGRGYVKAPTSARPTAGMTISTGLTPLQMISYRLDSSRDLMQRRNQLTFLGMATGRERERRQGLSASYDLPILRAGLAPRVTWNGNSGLIFLQPNSQANEPDRYNSYGNGRQTGYSARVSLPELAKSLRGVGKAKPGSEGAPPPPPQSGGKRTLGISMGTVNLSYSRSLSTNYDKRKSEPSLLYQLGIEDRLPSDDRALSGSSNRRNGTKSLSLDTTFRLPQSVALTTKYRKSETATVDRTQRSHSTSSTWPDVDVNWGTFAKSLTKALRLEGRIKTITATTHFTREETESGTGGRVRDDLRVTTSLAPLLNLNATFSSGLSITLNSSSRSGRQSKTFPSAVVTESVDRDVTLTLKKSLNLTRTILVPVTNQKKVVQTKLDINSALEIRTQKQETKGTGLAGSAVGLDMVRWKFTGGGNYGFTGNINGNVSINFGQDTNRKNEADTSRFVGISLAAAFTF